MIEIAKTDRKDGEYKMWYENGQLAAQASYKDGRLDGEYKTWYDNGQLTLQSSCKEGKFDGELKHWDEDGQLTDHAYYERGAKVKWMVGRAFYGFW